MTPINLRAAEARALLDAGRCEVVRVMRPQPEQSHDLCGTPAEGLYWRVGSYRLRPHAANPLPCPLPAPGSVVACREPFWARHDETDCEPGDTPGDLGPSLDLGKEFHPGVEYRATPECVNPPELKDGQTVERWDGSKVPGDWWLSPDSEWDGNSDHSPTGNWVFLPWALWWSALPASRMPTWAIRLHARVESRGAEVRDGKWCWVAVVVREKGNSE